MSGLARARLACVSFMQPAALSKPIESKKLRSLVTFGSNIVSRIVLSSEGQLVEIRELARAPDEELFLQAVGADDGTAFAVSSKGSIWTLIMRADRTVLAKSAHQREEWRSCRALAFYNNAIFLVCKKMWKLDLSQSTISEYVVDDGVWDTAAAATSHGRHMFLAARNLWCIDMEDAAASRKIVPFSKLRPFSTSWERCNGLAYHDKYLFAFCSTIYRVNIASGEYDEFHADDDRWSSALSAAVIGDCAYVPTSTKRLWCISLLAETGRSNLHSSNAVKVIKHATQWDNMCIAVHVEVPSPPKKEEDLIILGVSLSSQDQQRFSGATPAALYFTVETMISIEATLRKCFLLSLAQVKIPLLLVRQPCTLLDLRANIAKFLQYGFLNFPDLRYQLWAYQFITDYCVGLAMSTAQEQDFFISNGPDAEHIARMVLAYCKKHPAVRYTAIKELLSICEAHRGTAVLDADFLDHP